MIGSGENELNSLALCFQAVSQDLKTSNASIEVVCGKAIKLANQLNATITCLVGFADAIQVVSDSAKWASRDIGTSLTRFCLRQRSLESEIRSIAVSLVDQFAKPLEKKATEWKHNLSEIERRHQKNMKKTRSKKQIIGVELVKEHKLDCTALLLEQRSQFSTFASFLLPVINAQLRFIEEGLHINAIKEEIEQNISSTNTEDIINTVIEDVCNSGDSSWRKRLASPTKNQKIQGACNDSNSSPSSSSLALSYQNDTNSVYYGTVSSASSSRPHTLSNSVDFGKRAAISAQTFVPPTGTPFVQSSIDFSKPPLPRRPNDVSSYGNGDHNTFSTSSNDVSGLRQRPLSFNGEEAQLSQEVKRGDSLSEQISHLVDKFNDEIHTMCDQSLPPQQFDCNTVRRLGSEPCSVSIRRPESIRPPPPMPPERRNSTITSATPTAPSIFDLRNAGMFSKSNPSNGRVRSIQDLNAHDGIIYRSSFSNSTDDANLSDSLPDPPMSSTRASSYQPNVSYRTNPPAYNPHF